MSRSILTLELRLEQDVVLARQRARQIADLLGLETGEQTRVATAVSEIARNAFVYAGGGRVHFSVDEDPEGQLLVVRVCDTGPGIADLDRILEGRYRSSTGAGLGIIGARRLMDRFTIESSPDTGTAVVLGRYLPQHRPPLDSGGLGQVAAALARTAPRGAMEEVRQQNRELLRALEELRSRQEQLSALNHELEDTNRGVLALYAELAEKADHLRRADELKSRFLSNMSHEFRTPLHSILAIARLLLDRTDGDLTVEQEKQVSLVRNSAQELLELVNDLLDLAKVEAGRITVRPSEFTVTDLFSALKGMLRPLLVGNSVALVFEEPVDVPALYTDEAKVSQILRNFISNALKFTERGEVRVRARPDEDGDAIVFDVSDTGIGIPADQQERIFQEFGQVEGPHQEKVKGTGLGLPLSRRLAELLGGRLSVRSEPGTGSVFTAVIPFVYPGPEDLSRAPEVRREPDPVRLPVLVVEDNRELLLIYDRYLRGTGFQVIPARTLREARRALEEVRPVAIVLDILLGGEYSWDFLGDLKRDEATRAIPVVVATVVENRQKALGLGADYYAAKPVERDWLLGVLREAGRLRHQDSVLVVDDDEASRYVVKALLAETRYAAIEASGGAEALRLARETHPRAIVLDLVMPGMSGYEVLARLKGDAATRSIPVIVSTSGVLTEEDQTRLIRGGVVAVLSKETASSRAAADQLAQALRAAERSRGGRAEVAA